MADFLASLSVGGGIAVAGMAVALAILFRDRKED
jgi:hypothetical protein